MSTISELKDELRSLSLKAQDVVNDRSLTTAQKRTRLDAIEADIKSKNDRLADEEYLVGQRRKFGGDTKSTKPTLGAPSLDISRKTVEELHKAAVNRQVMVKAVDTGDSPMGTIAYEDLPPFVFPRERTRILELIPTESVDAPTVHYYRTATAATAAAPVAEGANKPESSPTWEQVTVSASKIAHYARVNDEVIADFGPFLELIRQEMVAGLINAENNQLLNGSGVAPQMTGLLNASGILTRARTTETHSDVLFMAITDLRTGSAFVEPDTIILNPADWQDVRLAKDANDAYLNGGAMDPAAASRLWGVNVAVTTQIAAGTAIVANLKEAARVYVRQGPTFEVHPGGGGAAEFIANQTLVRAEERLAGVAVIRPTAIVKVTGL